MKARQKCRAFLWSKTGVIMSKLYDFFRAGIIDQLSTAGESCTYRKGDFSQSINAVITEQNGDLALELGGMLYTVNGHALIADNAGFKPAPGASLQTNGGAKYLLITAIKSITDAAYSCTLHRIA